VRPGQKKTPPGLFRRVAGAEITAIFANAVSGVTLPEGYNTNMEDLHADWKTIQGHLQGIKGFDARAMERFFEEGPAKKGVHFFLVRYDAGEVIMAKGTTSDYAALHVQGLVRVRDIVPAYRTTGQGCWDRPLARRLENLVLCHAPKVEGQPEGAAPVRGWLGWTSWPLALLYRTVPALPLRVLGFAEAWCPARFAEAWRRHVARVLAGRLPPVQRAERELSNPKMAPAAHTSTGAPPTERALRIYDGQGQLRPAEERFMGIAGTLWNQPRSISLVADTDPDDEGKPCVMLLIKRKALEEIIKKASAFFEHRMQDFVDTVLPDILTRNRLFQNRLYAADVRDWGKLLTGITGGSGEFLHRVRELLDSRLMRWLPRADAERLDGPDRNHIIEGLNQVLARRELLSARDTTLAGGSRSPSEIQELAQRPSESLNDAEVFRLNRLLLEAALPGVVTPSPRPAPLTRDQFRDFTLKLAAAHRDKFGKVLRPERLEVVRDKRSGTKKGVVVCKQGDPADTVILVLSGMVRVNMDLAGGRTMVNNLGADTSFGESAILDAAGPDGAPPRRTASVETLCDTTLLRLDGGILRRLCEGDYRPLGDKLRRQRELFTSRDEQMRAGRLLPPSDPPVAIAERLVLTRNLLLIDMHKCTRCDQCVRGCAEAHDLVPRFHRANPELRFGKWEVAGACLHCLDAPCQTACPVGAITFLEDSAVQIHRDRCIGCSQCANECPFSVIDMYVPTSPADAPSSKKGLVANKCDLCLTEERDPPCVACCPYDAATRVAPVEFFPELRTWAGLAERSEQA
jgi:Fe-S-cluster-containing hydrogenase component 2/CRP-like cAMP-binding protein